ncbi:MAG: hypothetical protein MJZ32_11220 [Bacteroidaceae bacterium]|nr:hypothetical protein [Bacteroidaceae bacterium]
MKKLLLTFGAVFASVSVFAQIPGMLLRQTEVIGDAMGESRNATTQWTKPFYDKEGRVIREAVYGLCGDGSIEITRYTTNEYNALGQLVRKSSQQYGMYDGLDLAFRAVNDTTTYAYDANGNLILELAQEYEKKEYTYDANGKLIKKVRYSWDRTSWVESEVTEYSDFVNGNPTKLNNTGRWESYNYVAEIAYDANGNKVKELHYNNWTDKKLVGNSFYWTYDADGFCKLYEKKIIREGVEEEYLRTIYKKVYESDQKVRVEEKTQTYSSGQWYNQATSLVHEYAKYNHADYAPELAAEKIGDENKIKLSITLPKQAAADGDKAALKIMDNGIILCIMTVAEARANGILSTDGKTITYTTNILKNGKHEFLAQYVQASDEELSETSTTDWNFSAPVMVVLDKFLPKATNIRAVAADKDDNGLYTLTITWDAAPDAEAYSLIRYNVLMKGYSVAENHEDKDKALDLTWTLINLDGPVSIMIQAVYPYGKANTEYVTLNPKDYVQITDDKRICVEEECTFVEGNNLNADAGVTLVEKFFVDANDVVNRSAIYNYDKDGNLQLAQYNKYAYDGDVLTITSDENTEVRKRTFDENGKLATETYDLQEGTAKYQYVVTYNYSAKDGRLESEVTKRAKYKSNGSLGASSVYAQTTYTNDPDDDGIVYGVLSTYDAMKAKWTEGARIKRYMMPAKSTYAPTAKALELTKEYVVISAMPQPEHVEGIAAFNIFRDGELIAKGVSLLDEEHMKTTETGEFVDWNFKDLAPEGKAQCEYIVQFATLNDLMEYNRPYASSAPFDVDFAHATGISVIQNTESRMQNYFNLAGQKVSKDYSGIVIINGKKKINK